MTDDRVHIVLDPVGDGYESVMETNTQLTVRNNEKRSRYELVEDDEVVAIADYRLTGDRVLLPHTEVLPNRRGQGLGDVVVRGALDDLRARDRTIVPRCWFVADFLERNADYADLVA